MLVPDGGDGRNAALGKVACRTENSECMRVRIALISAAIRADVNTLKALSVCRAKRRQNKRKYTDSFEESVQITPHLVDRLVFWGLQVFYSTLPGAHPYGM